MPTLVPSQVITTSTQDFWQYLQTQFQAARRKYRNLKENAPKQPNEFLAELIDASIKAGNGTREQILRCILCANATVAVY
jgi:hypothetical protein